MVTAVRVMKTERALKEQLLIQSIVSEVSKRFMPQVSDVKKALENLIERKYIARDDSDPSNLTYVA